MSPDRSGRAADKVPSGRNRHRFRGFHGHRARPPAPRRDAMPQQEFTDAIALLKADHRTVEDLFEKFCSASSKDRKLALAQQICNELKIHAEIAETRFYPALDGKTDEVLLRYACAENARDE